MFGSHQSLQSVQMTVGRTVNIRFLSLSLSVSLPLVHLSLRGFRRLPIKMAALVDNVSELCRDMFYSNVISDLCT